MRLGKGPMHSSRREIETQTDEPPSKMAKITEIYIHPDAIKDEKPQLEVEPLEPIPEEEQSPEQSDAATPEQSDAPTPDEGGTPVSETQVL